MPKSKDVTNLCALVGHPNVGKSLLFQRLTGTYANVSNYPGTTVEFSMGRGKTGSFPFILVDTPGLYSLDGISEEEKAAASWLISNKPDLILQVIDMSNIPRMLKLTAELASLKIPVILVLNMADEAVKAGIQVDISLLSKLTGSPVVALTAITCQGLGQLLKVMESFFAGEITPRLPEVFPYRTVARRCYNDNNTRLTGNRKTFAARLDNLLLHPVGGWLFLFALLYLGLYRFVGGFGAGYLVDLLDNYYIIYLKPVLVSLVTGFFPEEGFQELLIGQFGMLTVGLRYAVTIILPVISAFFFFFAFLEDSGYLPRLAYLITRPLAFLGLNGKAALPLTLGFGCGTMAVAVTRILDSPRERFLAAFILALGIPCSAQMGLMAALLSLIPGALFIWLIVTGLTVFIAGRIMHLIIPGERQPLLLEMPPLRLPRCGALWRKTSARVVWYFKEVVPIFLGISMVLWVLSIMDFLEVFLVWLEKPLAVLALPPETAVITFTGFLRRDYGAAGLFSLYRQGALLQKELLVLSVFLTLLPPCLAQVSLTLKERGWLQTSIILFLVIAIAFTVSYTVKILF